MALCWAFGNGFQTSSLGLVPTAMVRPMDDTCPTLTFNTTAATRASLFVPALHSTMSPWLRALDDIHTNAISHGEGRFVASDELLETLKANGPDATRNADATGAPSMDLPLTLTVLSWLEGITSPDGRVLGKMGHTELRRGPLPRTSELTLATSSSLLIEGGVEYFSKVRSQVASDFTRIHFVMPGFCAKALLRTGRHAAVRAWESLVRKADTRLYSASPPERLAGKRTISGAICRFFSPCLSCFACT